MKKRIVIALGHRALGTTLPEQKKAVKTSAAVLADMVEEGYQLVITHSNAPQVGMIHTAMNEFGKTHPDYTVAPMSVCSAMSQGYIGYHLQQGMRRTQRANGMPWQVAPVVTQVVVDPDDPAFGEPTKPIGAFYDEAAAQQMMRDDPSLRMREDSGRGWRRVVASQKPVNIAERRSILNLLDSEYIVIACGGGGIPVTRQGNHLKGASAVIDKDFASCLLAQELDADFLIILTAVEKVAINFGKPNEQWLEDLTVEEAKKYMEQGQFGEGDMFPKIEAAFNFFGDSAIRSVLITKLNKDGSNIHGGMGTMITK